MREMTAQIRGVESGMPASRLEANVCYLGLTPKPTLKPWSCLGELRVIRHLYLGAVYHQMARGHGGKVVFENDEDRKGFLLRFGKVCACHGWRVHAWMLMDNHFYLLVETL